MPRASRHPAHLDSPSSHFQFSASRTPCACGCTNEPRHFCRRHEARAAGATTRQSLRSGALASPTALQAGDAPHAASHHPAPRSTTAAHDCHAYIVPSASYCSIPLSMHTSNGLCPSLAPAVIHENGAIGIRHSTASRPLDLSAISESSLSVLTPSSSFSLHRACSA